MFVIHSSLIFGKCLKIFENVRKMFGGVRLQIEHKLLKNPNRREAYQLTIYAMRDIHKAFETSY